LPAFSILAYAQTPQEIERELVANINEVQKYSDYGSNYDEEKLTNANKIFEEHLLRYTKIPATLNYKFPQLNKLITIATSADGRIRIYSWDTETGGTMHEYSRVYQFRGADGRVYSKTEDNSAMDGGAGSFVYAIYSVDAKEGKVYIVCSTFIGSTNDHYQSANLFRIERNELKDKIKLIKTKSGMTDTISFEYNFFSVVNREERPVRLILFENKTNTLKIPVVVNTEEYPNGKVTKKFIDYRFDGKYFVRVN
jgi:hypothetical protein